MPKMKTKRAAKKRFKVTATGKVKFKKAGKRHQLGHRKRASKKLAKRKGSYVHPSSAHHALACVPYLA
ncbi:MAG: 50S ribosomal protein L35 [Deltaproteobacteria bacterium]|nr:50S ribosomal protein L35 [Deltaproteobacteria bacterium]